MQKQLLTLLIIFYSANAYCQIDKGNWMLGGVVSYAYTRYESEYFGVPHDYYALNIDPSLGYFFLDKLGIGIKAGINKIGTRSAGTSKYLTYTDFNVGPFARYYFLPKENILNFLAEAGYQYGYEGGKNGRPSKNTFTFSAGPVAYFNSSVGLEFLVTYSTYKFSAINGSDGTIRFGLGLQIHLEPDK